MSFTENPYKNLKLVRNKTGDNQWECESCGAKSIASWNDATQVREIWQAFKAHIKDSHNRLPVDFEGWE